MSTGAVDVLYELRRQGVTGSVYYAVAALVEAATEYRRECENPAPDYLLRNQRREQLFAALARIERARHG